MHRTCYKPIPRFQSSSHPPGRLFRRAGSFMAAVTLFLSTMAGHAAIPADQPLPTPTYGINLGNTLEPPNGEGTWGPAATQSVINSIAAQGFNSIRIPCAWDSHANQSTYQIDPVYMARVKQVVDWAIAAGLYVVVNDHWDGGWLENNLTTTVDPVINAKMNAYWTQIATTFAGYDNHLLFAGANEPSVASPVVMDTLMVYYQTFIDAVRGTGGNNANRWLVLQSVSDPLWMNNLPLDPTPNRMMVEYHQYTPSLFTIFHTDQTWGNAIYFWGQAYHYSGNPSRNATWGEEDEIDAFYQQLYDQYVSQGIPVMIGEFGAWTASLSGTEATWNRNSQLYWDKYAAESARAHGINPFYWSIQNDVFDWTTGAVLDPDVINVLTGGDAPPPPNGAPYAVSGLTATAGTGQIDLSWNAASGAASYNLYRATASGGECNLAPFATGITGTSYTDSGLNDGVAYYYQVVAVNGSGLSGFTAEAHATTSGTNPDMAPFNFESSSQGWTASGSQISGVAVSSAQAYVGNQSLAVNFNGSTSGTSAALVGNVAITAGSTITFHVWIPVGSPVNVLQPYLMDYNWGWTSSWYGSLTPGAWNTVTLTVPTTAVTPLQELGLQFTTTAAWAGTCYIDSITWDVPLPSVPTGLAATGGYSQNLLSWNASSGATGYNVKRATASGGPYATIGAVSSTGYTDDTVVNGTPYYYVVSALNSVGESADSAEASATSQGGSAPVDDLANADMPIAVSVSGSYTDTHASDNSYETLTEVQSGGKPNSRYSYLEHEWTINVAGGSSVIFYVEAHKTANSEGDDFVFAYSTDNANFTDMLTVTKTVDDNIAQSYVLPASVHGTVYIRVVDTDHSSGNRNSDSLFVDEMYIRSSGTPPANQAPAFTSDPVSEAGAIEGSSYGSSIADNASDPDGDTLSFSKVSGPAWLNIAANGSLSGTPAAGDVGLNSWTVQVDDGRGGSATATLEINVDPAGTQPEVYIADIAMSSASYGGGRISGIASITVKDDSGAVVPYATVSVNWTGTTTESASGTTGGNGVVSFESSKVKRGGTYTVTVTGVTASGSTYNPALNVKTSDSITAP